MHTGNSSVCVVKDAKFKSHCQQNFVFIEASNAIYSRGHEPWPDQLESVRKTHLLDYTFSRKMVFKVVVAVVLAASQFTDSEVKYCIPLCLNVLIAAPDNLAPRTNDAWFNSSLRIRQPCIPMTSLHSSISSVNL